MAGTPGVDDATRAVVVAIYCRLSQFGGKGLGRQEEDCRRIATTRGWVVGEVYQETASANPYSKKARKEWLRLLDAIQHREFDAVVVWLEDRPNAEEDSSSDAPDRRAGKVQRRRSAPIRIPGGSGDA